MPILNLDFLNKNQFRSYPFKADTSRKAEDGRKVSDGLVTSCTITTTQSRTNIHINQIFVQDGYISLTVACKEEDKYKSIGVFHGTPTADFYALEFVQFERFVGGKLTLGLLSELTQMTGGYFFEPAALELEESSIFYYTPPGVTSINNREISLRGHVRFGKLFNLTKKTDKPTRNIALAVQDNSSIASLADHTSEFNNCKTPLIHYVNGAKPFYNADNPDNQGNLYLVGVKPIIFYGVMGEGSIDIQTRLFDDSPLDLSGLCTARNKVLPPVAPAYLLDRNSEMPQFKGRDNHYAKSFEPPENVYSNSEPEFLSWPQFFKNFHKTVTITPAEQVYEIKQIALETGDLYRIIFINFGESPAEMTLLKNAIPLESVQNIQLASGQKVIKNLASPVKLEEGLTFSISGKALEALDTSIRVMLYYR